MQEKLEKIRLAVKKGNIFYRQHAVEMMIEREINRADVLKGIYKGEIIEEYTDDKPFPSCLLCFLSQDTNLHVVLAYDEQEDIVFIITVYIPDLKHFEEDFKTRRK